jgi:hypothetical protein
MSSQGRSGIHLEDANETLPWGCTRDQAWGVGRPQRRFEGDDTRIEWEEKILGGLPCRILAYLPGDATLDEVTVTFRPAAGAYRWDDPVFHYLVLFDHLVRHFGTPSSVQPSAGSLYAPILTWERDECTFQLITGERHVDFAVLGITHGKRPRIAT